MSIELELRTTYSRDPNDVAQTRIAPSLFPRWLPRLTLKRAGSTGFDQREVIVGYILRPR